MIKYAGILVCENEPLGISNAASMNILNFLRLVITLFFFLIDKNP